MTRPAIMQAIEAAKALRRRIEEGETWNSADASAIRTLLDYTQSDRWRFGWTVTDFGDIVPHVGPPDSFDGLQRHFATPHEAVDAIRTEYDDGEAEFLERQFKLMGVMA